MRLHCLLTCSVPLLLWGACAQVHTAAAPTLVRAAEPAGPAAAVAPAEPLAEPSVAPSAAPTIASASEPPAPELTRRWWDEPPPVASPRRAGADGVELSYTYAEAGANFLELDDVGGNSEDVDAYYIDGSLALGMFHIVGGYENQSTDFQNTDTALYRLGAGIHLDVRSDLSLAGEIAWLFTDVSSDLSSLDGTNNGYQVRGGARWMPIGWDRGGLELEGNLIWIDIDNLLSDDESVGFEAGARVHMFKYLSVGALYTVFEDDELFGINARVSF